MKTNCSFHFLLLWFNTKTGCSKSWMTLSTLEKSRPKLHLLVSQHSSPLRLLGLLELGQQIKFHGINNKNLVTLQCFISAYFSKYCGFSSTASNQPKNYLNDCFPLEMLYVCVCACLQCVPMRESPEHCGVRLGYTWQYQVVSEQPVVTIKWYPRGYSTHFTISQALLISFF